MKLLPGMFRTPAVLGQIFDHIVEPGMPLRRHGARLVLASIDDPAFAASILRLPLLVIVAVTKIVGTDQFTSSPRMEPRTNRRH